MTMGLGLGTGRPTIGHTALLLHWIKKGFWKMQVIANYSVLKRRKKERREREIERERERKNLVF